MHQEEEYPDYHGFNLSGMQENGPITTADVDFQEQGCNDVTLHFLLPIASRRLVGRILPPEIVDHIITFVGERMTREKAEEHRRLLMADRKPSSASDEDDSVSLTASTAAALGD